MARARVLYPLLLSVAELADAMHCDRRHVYRMIANGLPLYRMGVKRRILVADAVEHIRTHFKRDGSPK